MRKAPHCSYFIFLKLDLGVSSLGEITTEGWGEHTFKSPNPEPQVLITLCLATNHTNMVSFHSQHSSFGITTYRSIIQHPKSQLLFFPEEIFLRVRGLLSLSLVFDLLQNLTHCSLFVLLLFLCSSSTVFPTSDNSLNLIYSFFL